MEKVFDSVKNPTIIKINYSYPITLTLAFEQEPNDILAFYANAYVKNLSPQSGVISVKGNALFNIIYKEEGEMKHYESGADFSFDVTDEKIAPSCLADFRLFVQNIEYKKSEGGISVTAEILASGEQIIADEKTFLTDISGAIVQKKEVPVLAYVGCCNSVAEAEGEKTFHSFIEKIICYNDEVKVISQTAGINEIVVEGEIYSELLVISKGGERSSERIVTPFRYEVDCDIADPRFSVVSVARISERSFKISSEEEENKSVVSAAYTMRVYSSIFETRSVNCVIDGFSTSNEMELEMGDFLCLKEFYKTSFSHKHFGECTASFETTDFVSANLFPEAQVTNYFCENGKLEINGLVSCFAIIKNKEGEYSCQRAEAPFGVSFDCDGEPLKVDASVKKGLTRNLDGKCLLECELDFCVWMKNEENERVVCSFVEGEERAQKQSAISVIFINKGDDLWSVCKKALASEQSILADNPGITFPAKEDKAVVVYRKL